MDTIPKPRGRRPGNSDTRYSILQAALGLFSRFGYDKVSLRAVAREADVDPALIHHYFDSKADLFTRSVLDIEFNAEAMLQRVMASPREVIGQQAVREFVAAWRSAGARERFTAMFRAAVNDDGARRPLIEFVNREIFMKIALSQGHTNATLRANLAMSALLGLVMTRDILEIPTLQSAKDDELVRGLGAALQQLLVEPW
ncbi:MAG: TetR family transcriptional regulator [Propionicimonas sp.]|nr:TetR family transcriptional regulator [Propionicimonas sp.]